jgi:hypothetical protein
LALLEFLFQPLDRLVVLEMQRGRMQVYPHPQPLFFLVELVGPMQTMVVV